jgi:hypothetical protein
MPDINIPNMGTLVGLCVPAMGMHALVEAEANVEDFFSATMVVGYYKQEVIFIEPMVAYSTMMAGDNFSLQIPSLDRGELREPDAFEAIYNADDRAYSFTFSMPGN